MTDDPPETDWDSLAGTTAIESDFALETSAQVTARKTITRPRHRKCLSAIKAEELASFFETLPAPGETIHMVSNGRFDYWLLAPRTQELIGHPCTFYGSTWTMNRANVLQLLQLFDTGRFDQIAILTGTYFKKRESAVANTLIEGITSRRQRFLAFQNHAKVMLLGCAKSDTWISIEGSANFTANPRLEQNTVTNDRDLYRFHQTWMDDILSAPSKGDI